MHHEDAVSAERQRHFSAEPEMSTRRRTFVLTDELLHSFVRSCQSIVRGVDARSEIIEHPVDQDL